MFRVGIIALLHESNTFIEVPTDFEHFRTNLLAEGGEVLDAFRNTSHEVGGFLEVLDQEKTIEGVGVFGARAMPYGTIAKDCWLELMERLDVQLKKAGRLDGILVAPHGATVAQGAAHADGYWLQKVRQAVGPGIPILGTLDLHANVSPAMVQATNGLVGYRTNPHLDQKERGMQSANWMVRTLRGQITPCQSLVQLPLCVNIERQATSEPQGQRLWEFVERVESGPGALAISCFYGFPYADVNEMGASVLAVWDGSEEKAFHGARGVAEYWWDHRSEFEGNLVSIDEALARADKRHRSSVAPCKPIGLLDMGDNVGGGSPGDGTWIAWRWLEQQASVPNSRQQKGLLTVIVDPIAVALACKTGIGGTLKTRVGGRIDPERHGPPITGDFQVCSLSDGRFCESEVRHGGYSQFDQGASAVLRSPNGLTILAITHRVPPLSLQQVLSQGLKLEDFELVVIKGVHAPVAAYRDSCSELIRVDTSGVTTANLDQLSFLHRRRPMEPFEKIKSFKPAWSNPENAMRTKIE